MTTENPFRRAVEEGKAARAADEMQMKLQEQVRPARTARESVASDDMRRRLEPIFNHAAEAITERGGYARSTATATGMMLEFEPSAFNLERQPMGSQFEYRCGPAEDLALRWQIGGGERQFRAVEESEVAAALYAFVSEATAKFR